jgi:hypothetical protein
MDSRDDVRKCAGAAPPARRTKGESMRRTILFVVALTGCSFAWGQALTLVDVKAKSAVQLSADDAKQLLSGATVVNQIPSGSTRRWQNSASGDLAASSDGRGNAPPRVFSGSGTWKIDDKGAYCVHIKWPMQVEEWCRYVFKAGDKYYTFLTLDDSAKAWEFEISK